MSFIRRNSDQIYCEAIELQETANNFLNAKNFSAAIRKSQEVIDKILNSEIYISDRGYYILADAYRIKGLGFHSQNKSGDAIANLRKSIELFEQVEKKNDEYYSTIEKYRAALNKVCHIPELGQLLPFFKPQNNTAAVQPLDVPKKLLKS